MEVSLRHAKEQADAASAAKSSFLANMSHEIRTPMNAVLGMLHLVQFTPLNLRQRDYVSKAQSAAQSLLGLLNDILDYSKIEAGKLQLDPHPFDFEPLMQDLGVVLAGNQGQKDIEVLFDIDQALPAV
ncbi:histidine kinase dimerization/phospho-acceptor domain-containing protein [Pseudomonas sp. PCH446]